MSQAASASPVFSIDVECVATGTTHNARAVAQIALVDAAGQLLLNLYVLPAEPIVSYLTPLTGLTADILTSLGMPLEAALALLRRALPRTATLVGQSISKDIEWLGLKEGVDFAGLIDLSGLYRVWNPQYKSWSMFGQDHVLKVLLPHMAPPDEAPHDAVGDAIKSIHLYAHHGRLTAEGHMEAAQVRGTRTCGQARTPGH